MPPLYASVGLVLTPASLMWSPVFAGYYVYLGTTISLLRSKTAYYAIKGTLKGDDGAVASTADVQALQVASRAHANFAEQVPISLILSILAELNGAPTYLIHTLYATLFSLRVAHNEFGMKINNTIGAGRPIGTAGTWLVLLSTGVYNWGLGWETFKSFAGF